MKEEKTKAMADKYGLSGELIPEERAAQSYVVKNLNYLMFKHNIRVQKDLAELLDIGAPQLTKILKGEQTPTIYPFLANVRKYFHYSIDEFLFTDIKAEENVRSGNNENLPTATYMKFVGLYQIYYFDTSAFKGRERSDNRKALKSGVMYVEKDDTSEKYRVTAVFNLRKERADDLYRVELCGEKNRPSSYYRQYLTSKNASLHVYYGELELSAKHVYISLRFENTRDRVNMIFHRPESNSNQYIGGLGTMISVSKGRNAAPCLQYVALANESLEVSEEELASHLLMHYPNLKSYDTIEDLVAFTADLYGGVNDDRLGRLTEEQKKSLVRASLDKIINDTVEKNLFRTVIVSAVDDDEFYHYIKRVKSYMRSEVR